METLCIGFSEALLLLPIRNFPAGMRTISAPSLGLRFIGGSVGAVLGGFLGPVLGGFVFFGGRFGMRCASFASCALSSCRGFVPGRAIARPKDMGRTSKRNRDLEDMAESPLHREQHESMVT